MGVWVLGFGVWVGGFRVVRYRVGFRVWGLLLGVGGLATLSDVLAWRRFWHAQSLNPKP